MFVQFRHKRLEAVYPVLAGTPRDEAPWNGPESRLLGSLPGSLWHATGGGQSKSWPAYVARHAVLSSLSVVVMLLSLSLDMFIVVEYAIDSKLDLKP